MGHWIMLNTSFLNKTQLKNKKYFLFFILLGRTWFNAFKVLNRNYTVCYTVHANYLAWAVYATLFMLIN